MTSYAEFARYTGEINDLLCTLNLLEWDARTQMPPGGAHTRGQQMATLTRLAQERFAGAEMGRLIEAATTELAGTDPDAYPARAVAAAAEAWTIAQRLPPTLMAEKAEVSTVAQSVWQEARAQNDFARFAPWLERLVAINRRIAEAIGYAEHPYDALVAHYEPGMSARRLCTLFDELRGTLVPLLERIAASGVVADTRFLDHDYPADLQRAFALDVAREFGYDLQRGRVDVSTHPFEVSFTRQDVRITTRYQLRNPLAAIFGLFHETGHALYEQGVDPELTRSALTTDYLGFYAVGGASYGTHESQSRLWENQIGRSRAFWILHYPQLQAVFPAQLGDVSLDTFYHAVNRIQPGLIRVEADEVSYDLHIMLRVELEMALLDGSLAVADLPQAWNAKVQAYLGLTPPDDTRGVLQDIHWSSGLFGSFPTYTIGNIMAAQLMEAARSRIAGMDEALAAGDYAPLRIWLQENIYRHGRAYTPEELLVRTTGRGLDTRPYLDCLTGKYAELYPTGG